VLVIGDSLDSAVRAQVHPNDSFDRPRAVAEEQENDRRLTVYLAQCQPPRHGHA